MGEDKEAGCIYEADMWVLGVWGLKNCLYLRLFFANEGVFW